MATEYEAAQEAGRIKGARRMREDIQRLQAEKELREREKQQQAEQQLEQQQQQEAQQLGQEDGEVFEEAGAREDQDDEIVMIESKPKVKEDRTASEAARNDGAGEKARLAEHQVAAEEVKKSTGKQQQNGDRYAAAKAARQAELREKMSSRPKPSTEENPLTSWGARKEPLQKNGAGPRLDTTVLNGRKGSDSSSKRPEPASGFTDDRRSSKKRGSISNSSSAVSSPRSPLPTSASATERQPPEWYKKLKFDGSRGRNASGSGVDVLLNALKDQIRKAQGGRSDLNAIFNEVRTRLHRIFFLEVTPKDLRNTKILDNETGLPQIFDKRYSQGVQWPFYIRADAEELYNKWCRQDFLTDLMRGIQCGKPKINKEVSDRSSDKIESGYPALPAAYYGNGHLLNGQWWPTQLTCLRDGAHGVSQGGIAGPTPTIDGKSTGTGKNTKKPKGAWSCIMSGGHGYGEDEDHGDWVLYCGTDSTDGTITDSTQKMIDSVGGQPVRLIRSHNLKSPWAPEIGFRYDGLYDVVSMERIDPEGHPRARHRFKLVRQDGQDPIRGGEGPERRPTDEEMKAYKDDKRLRGF